MAARSNAWKIQDSRFKIQDSRFKIYLEAESITLFDHETSTAFKAKKVVLRILSVRVRIPGLGFQG